ncbi:DUF1974 domain-containing protein, partial [Proteus mirabilis]|uniref:acyl-CoA dehydrogenase domain-containing protein n=1 Tax=Proteus mirabilis TaxID=584 RepID=UPI002574E1B5
ELLLNFPNRYVAVSLRAFIFPLVKVKKMPSDKLDSKVSQNIQQPYETRERNGKGQNITPSEHNPHGIMEEALLDIINQ